MRFATLIATVSMCVAAVANAQVIQGRAVDSGGRPIAGVVALLVDHDSRVVARVLSDTGGAFTMSAPSAGAYRVRTMRIGYKPSLSEEFELGAAATIVRRFPLAGAAVALEAVHVVAQNACRAFSDAGAETFAVWEQVTTALTAAQITQASSGIDATTVVYERTLDPASSRVLAQRSSVSTDRVTRPWLTPPPEELRRNGYIVSRPDNTIDYYAPGIEALLSPEFVEDHCFRLVADDQHPNAIGLAFEPTPRRKVPEVRGTMWVDRSSMELRTLDVRYVNAAAEQEERASGKLTFVRMADGAWAVNRWVIQMPRVEQFVVPGHGAEPHVTSMQLSGGELALARRGDDTLWARAQFTVDGVVVDSATRTPVRGARIALWGRADTATTDDRGRFSLSRLLPGHYGIDVTTPSLDSINSSHEASLVVTDSGLPLELRVPSARLLLSSICGNGAGRDASTGVLLGRARFVDTLAAAPAHARVVAEWMLDAADPARVRQVTAPATADGQFRLCGIPVNVTVSLRATADSAESPDPVFVRLAPGLRLRRVQVPLERSAQLALRAATFSGVVVFDSTKSPIATVEVSIPGAGKTTVTDAAGQFRLEGIPPGEHQVSIRRIGYGAVDTRVAFRGNENVERRVVLGRAVSLEPVVVKANAIDHVMDSFEENRRVGLGHFLTRADLAKVENVSLASIIATIPGALVIRGRTAAWVRGSRAFKIIQIPPDEEDARAGAPIAACYSNVYLDNVEVFSGKHFTGKFEPLFNLNSINPSQIEAIEYYASPAETPLRYSGMESDCGVLVIWTRRPE